MKRASVALFVMVMFVLAAAAHGGKKHVRGTVEKINSDSIVVKAKDGNSILIKLSSSTMFIKRAGNIEKAAKPGDLAVGDLVVVHATLKETGLEADQVKFSIHGTRGAAPNGANLKP